MAHDKARTAYISGALTGVDDLASARRYYERLAAVCASCGLDPYVPHLRTDPERHANLTPQVVFEQDRAVLRSARVVVAYIGAPSLGVGAEVVLACSANTPVLALHRPDERVSRFILGYLRQASGARIVAASDHTVEDVVGRSLREMLAPAR
jgi:hypothetical protein